MQKKPGANRVNKGHRQVYDIVDTHLTVNIQLQLLTIVTGQEVSGKSYLINGLINFLVSYNSIFGFTAFNVKGQTLHSVFQLPIRGKKNGDLKDPCLQTLPENITGLKYIITDEFSVLGKAMFGWIYRRCRQATGKMDELLLIVNLFGETEQLPPISYKLLYCSNPTSETAMHGFCVHKEFKTVIKLHENKRASAKSPAYFGQLLVSLRNGDTTKHGGLKTA